MIRLYALDYNNQSQSLVSVTALAKRPLACNLPFVIGKSSVGAWSLDLVEP